ncbi:LacI family DNA-binding transcriptional regulator [Streptomyces sp. TS71-3]|uniref:LacI family DNA-binding transcriptional regulator n=1 Tax=Streptomyces sp. TS71-3 TaxID=2733862 RepID=UPI001B0FA0DA|nr:LacI family DNA-binding transcriptional regulator [Streptomyces sp. TS71-3]GHJ38751.1 LacI family transcriptional regulator [Streptomyces sp. TS71-3]
MTTAEHGREHPRTRPAQPTGHDEAGPRGRDTARPTSRDVASAAGVSQAAVSLVLSGKWQGRVSATTAERVRTAARDLGYRPNLAARNLRLGSTRTALLVVPALTSEFFAHVHTGAARIARRHGFGIVLYPTPEGTGPASTTTQPGTDTAGMPQQPPPVTDPFASAPAALDGVIASSMAAHTLSAIRGDRLPLVMLDSEPTADPTTTTVNPDIADGMRQVTHHLLALGHRRFLHLAAAVDSWTFRTRAHALQEALHGTGGDLRRVHAPLGTDEARAAAHAALTASGAPRPTALVCDDDTMAAGACKAARRLGLRIPQDLSVTGFDDLTLATAIEPELTTVRLPAEAVGEHGMSALLALLDGEPPAPGTLPCHLVVRASSGPPPAGG